VSFFCLCLPDLPWVSLFRNQLVGYGLDDRASIPDRGKNFFSSPPRPNRHWGSPSLISIVLFLGVRRPENRADYSPPYNDKVKNAWSYTFTPLYIMKWCLVKHRISFHDMLLS